MWALLPASCHTLRHLDRGKEGGDRVLGRLECPRRPTGVFEDFGIARPQCCVRCRRRAGVASTLLLGSRNISSLRPHWIVSIIKASSDMNRTTQLLSRKDYHKELNRSPRISSFISGRESNQHLNNNATTPPLIADDADLWSRTLTYPS